MRLIAVGTRESVFARDKGQCRTGGDAKSRMCERIGKMQRLSDVVDCRAVIWRVTMRARVVVGETPGRSGGILDGDWRVVGALVAWIGKAPKVPKKLLLARPPDMWNTSFGGTLGWPGFVGKTPFELRDRAAVCWRRSDII